MEASVQSMGEIPRIVYRNRPAEPTYFPELIGCPCTLCRGRGLAGQRGSKNWQRGTTRGVDATSISHATTFLDFTS